MALAMLIARLVAADFERAEFNCNNQSTTDTSWQFVINL